MLLEGSLKSTLHISKQALHNNFRAVHAAAGRDAVVLAVVKADAYGHGAALCAPVLAEAGARWFGVSDVAEGAIVRAAAGSDVRILVMCGMEPEDAPAILAHELTPVVWTPEHVHALQAAARAAGTRCHVHLELDTGMSRQGSAVGKKLDEVLRALETAPNLVLEGVMSHLCCAEAVHGEETLRQQRDFRLAVGHVCMGMLLPVYVHLANSSAVDEGSTVFFMEKLAAGLGLTQLVRPGLALYGHLLPLENAGSRDGVLAQALEPALTWTTRIIDLREVSAGTNVGYGATFTAQDHMQLALLPVGYADGFRRGASSAIGNGWVMIAGHRAPVVGRVSMNLTVVDVTAIDGVQIGDEVTLLGEGVNAEDHARWNGTIAYDILCGVRGHRVVA